MGIDELQAKIRKLKNPSIVALCPELSLLPPYLLAQARAELGDTLDAAAESYRRFCFAILDALVESVPAVSVESGCFSRSARRASPRCRTCCAARAKRAIMYCWTSCAATCRPRWTRWRRAASAN